MSIEDAIREAESILPGVPAPEGEEDPRWRAIIAVGNYVETNPNEIWEFVARWGRNRQEDVRDAIATCLLEHLLGCHFKTIFPLVEAETKKNKLFADTFGHCWKFGQAEEADNAQLFDRLQERC